MFQFKQMREEDLEQVLKWRVSPEVSRYMYTDVTFDREAHHAWFERYVKPNPGTYWVICFRNKPIGLIYLVDLDLGNHRTSYGYYIGDQEAWHLGGLVPLYFYNNAFSRKDLGIEKITAEVMSENDKVVQLHRFHGHEVIGTLKNQIYKAGKPHDVVLLELYKEKWLSLNKKFGHYQADFE